MNTYNIRNAFVRVRLIALLLAMLLSLTACGGGGSSFTDPRDGKKYRTIKLGEQIWMAENLNYEPSTGNSWCYNDDESYCAKYGRLYDWYAAKEACPSGWHLSYKDEWSELAIVAGSTGNIGGCNTGQCEDGEDYGVAGKKLKAKNGWNENGNGTDNFGFSALPGGCRDYIDGNFYDVGIYGNWWSAMEDNKSSSYGQNEHGDVKNNGFSVRCVQD